jgi:acetyl-CoA carboxylase biotin carboxylase subunit
MLAKLIVHAETRELAIARMRRALHELSIVGVDTSREFHLRVLDDEEFRRGEIDIQWLERRLPSLTGAKPSKEIVHVAAIAAALLAERDRGRRPTPAGGNGNTRANGSAETDYGSEWARAARREALRNS